MDYKLNLITPSLYSPDGKLNCKDDVVEEFAEYVKKRAENELNFLCKYDKIPGLAFIYNFEDFENRFLIHSEYAVIIASPFSQKALNQFIPRLLVFLTSKPIWQNRFLFVFLGDVKVISNLFTNDPIQFSKNKWDEQDEESWKTLLNLVKISWKPHVIDEQLSGSLNPCENSSNDERTSRKVNPIKKDLSLRPQVEITDIEIKSELLESTYCGKSFISLEEENEKIKEAKPNLYLDIMTRDNHGNESDENSDCSSEQTYICQPNIPNSPIPVIILEEDTFTKPDGDIDYNKDEQNINANIMIKNQSSLTQQVQESIVHKTTINFERQSIGDMSTCKILSEGLNSPIILKGSNIDNNDVHFKSGRHTILKYQLQEENYEGPSSIRIENEEKVIIKSNLEKIESEVPTEYMNKKEIENQSEILLLTDKRNVECSLNPQAIISNKKNKNPNGHEIGEKNLSDSIEFESGVCLLKFEEKREVEHCEEAVAKSDSHKVPFSIRTQKEAKVVLKPDSEENESVMGPGNVVNTNRKEIENQNGDEAQLLTYKRKTKDLPNPQTIHLSKKGKNLKEHEEIIEKQHLGSDECEPQMSLIKSEEKGQVEKSKDEAFVAKGDSHKVPFSFRSQKKGRAVIKPDPEKNESVMATGNVVNMNRKGIENQNDGEAQLLTDTENVVDLINPQTIYSSKKGKNLKENEEIIEEQRFVSDECEPQISLSKGEEKGKVEKSKEAEFIAKSDSHKVPFNIQIKNEGMAVIKSNSEKNERVIVKGNIVNTTRKEIENQDGDGAQLLTDTRKVLDRINPQTIHSSKKGKNLKENVEIIEEQHFVSDECEPQISLSKGEEKGKVEKSKEAVFIAKSESHKVPFNIQIKNEGNVVIKKDSDKNESIMVTGNVVNANRKGIENQNDGEAQLLTDTGNVVDLINPQTIHSSKKGKNLKENEEIIEKQHFVSDEYELQKSLSKGEEKVQVEKNKEAVFIAKSESHKLPFSFRTQKEGKVVIKPDSAKNESIMVTGNVVNTNRKEVENKNDGAAQLLTDTEKVEDLINPQIIHLCKKGKITQEHEEIIEKQHFVSDEFEPPISLSKGEEKGKFEKSKEAAFVTKSESHKVPFSIRTQNEGKVVIKPDSAKNESLMATGNVVNTNRKEIENQNDGEAQLLTDTEKVEDLIDPQTIHLSNKGKTLKEHEEIIERQYLDFNECESQIPLIKGEEKREDNECSEKPISVADYENVFENTVTDKVKDRDDMSSDNSGKKFDKKSRFNKSTISQLSHKEDSTAFEENNKSHGVLLPNMSGFQESVHVTTSGNEDSNRSISKKKPNQLNRSDENRKINEFKDGDKFSESSKRESAEKVIDYKKGNERIFSATNNDNIQRKNLKEQSNKSNVISDKMGSTKMDVSLGNENIVDSEMDNRAFKNGNGIKDGTSNKNIFSEEHISRKTYSVETNKLKTSDEDSKDIDPNPEIKENINKKSIIYDSDSILKQRVDLENVHDHDDESSDFDNLVIKNNILEVNTSAIECLNVKKEKMTLSMQMFNDDNQSCQEDITIITNSRAPNETFSFGISSLLAKIGSFSRYFRRTPVVVNSQLLIDKDKSPASKFWFFKYLQSPWCVLLLFATGTIMSPYWISLTRLKIIDNCSPIIMAEPTTRVLNQESVYKKYRYMFMRRGPTATLINFRIIAPHD